MGGVNIEKEQKEFEKELDEQEKIEFQERLKEQEKNLKNSNGFKPMFIYLYSNNEIPENFIKEICGGYESIKNVKINGVEVIESLNNEKKNWIFYIINKGNEEKLKAISQNFKNKDSVFICFSQNLFSPEIEQILGIFSKVFLKNQPFYLFLTNEKEPDINIILQKISSFQKMDKRNFFVMNYKNSEEDNFNILKNITKFFSYYNELGDTITLEDESNSFVSRFNILVCGRAGAGKSTFINKILNEKRCREGSGQSVTKKISFYNHSEYPLTIYDTPGFENSETVKNVVEEIKKQNKEFKTMKQAIHLILYLIRYGERTFLDFEKSVLSQLSKHNAKMLFIVTKSPYKINDELFEEYQDTLSDDIKDMFKDTPKEITYKLFGENYCDLLNCIFPVNSKKENNKDEEFGLDTLFEKCYELFRNEKIPYEILLELEKGEEKHIEEILSKYMLFKVYKSRKDIISSAKKNAMKKIIKFSFYSSIGSNLPSIGNSSNSERLLCAMASSLAKVYARNLTKAEAKVLVEFQLKRKENIINNSETNSLRQTVEAAVTLPILFVCWPIGLGVLFLSGSLNWFVNYKIGVSMSENFAKELEECIPIYLFTLAISFNKGIDSLKIIKEKYDKIYKDNAAPSLTP